MITYTVLTSNACPSIYMCGGMKYAKLYVQKEENTFREGAEELHHPSSF